MKPYLCFYHHTCYKNLFLTVLFIVLKSDTSLWLFVEVLLHWVFMLLIVSGLYQLMLGKSAVEASSSSFCVGT